MLLQQKSILCYHLLKCISSVLIVLFCSFSVFAQDKQQTSDAKAIHLNPLLLTAFKKPLKINPLLAERIKPGKHELMYWPDYPLTTQQIIDRDRKYDQPIGQQIAHEIIESYINAMIYGRKKPVVATPKF